MMFHHHVKGNRSVKPSTNNPSADRQPCSPLVEAIGWGGTGMIIASYALTSFAVIAATSPWNQLLNVVGSLGIALVSFRKRAYQPAVLNLVWLGIALISLLRSALA